MIMSYWSGPVIAHMLVSFGFENAEYVVFSVEIRPRKGESFSEIGGFFKEFGLSIVAADERLDSNYSFEELRARGRITERAKAADRSELFSTDIRRGIPNVEVAN
jgi:hypothetical protein